MWLFGDICDVCGKRRCLCDCSQELYEAQKFVGDPNPTRLKYVCDECFVEFVTVRCALCEEEVCFHNDHPNFVDGYFSREKWIESNRNYEIIRESVRRLPIPFVDLVNLPLSKEKPAHNILCEQCYEKWVLEFIHGIERLLKEDYEEDDSSPIVLDWNRENGQGCCCRCGNTIVDERGMNFMWFLYNVVTRDVKVTNPELQLKIKQYRQSRETVTTFVDKPICLKCVSRLVAEKILAYQECLRDEGWLGELNADIAKRYSIVHAFDKIKIDFDGEKKFKDRYPKELILDIHAFEKEMKERIVRIGGNGYEKMRIEEKEYKYELAEEIRAETAYVGFAMPVLLKAKSKNKTASVARVMIDGSNMLCAEGGGCTQGLKTCLRGLDSVGIKWHLFFDANVFHVLKDRSDDDGSVWLKGFIEKNQGKVTVVPSGARADDFILMKADIDGCDIISNDRYSQYLVSYSWLEDGRVHKFAFVENQLMIPDLNISEGMC